MMRSIIPGTTIFWLGSFVIAGTVCASIARADDRSGSVSAREIEDPADRGQPIWVFFRDKLAGDLRSADARIADVVAGLPERTRVRRGLRRTDPGLADARDLPIAPSYARAIRETGASIRHESRWLNAVSVLASAEQLARIRELEFVRSTQPVARAARRMPLDTRPAPAQRGVNPPSWYGWAANQLDQISVIAAHNAGYTGSGIVIGVLDTGFNRTHNVFNQASGGAHPIQVLGEYDFVNNDGNTAAEPGDDLGQSNHGTIVLATMAGYFPNQYVGADVDASYYLAKTEDVSQEVPAEEDHYVAGLEWIEMSGADLATSSLGYIDWYTQLQLNGATAVTTIAVNTATANGLVCCTAAGNAGNDGNPLTSHLIAPADAFQVLTCGATDTGGFMASFSSDGPTEDGRPKPEVLACGLFTWTIYPGDNVNYNQYSGTSLSTPLVAGGTSLILQAHPDWSVDKIRRAILHTSADFAANATFDPNFVRGYGVLNVMAAIGFVHSDVDGDGKANGRDVGPFVQALLGTNPNAGQRRRADVNASGQVNLADVPIFVSDLLGS